MEEVMTYIYTYINFYINFIKYIHEAGCLTLSDYIPHNNIIYK